MTGLKQQVVGVTKGFVDKGQRTTQRMSDLSSRDFAIVAFVSFTLRKRNLLLCGYVLGSLNGL